MKKLSKLLLVVMLLAFISPVTQIYAEPETETTETEEVEEVKEETDEEDVKEDEAKKEEDNVKVDEDNESPFLYGDEDDPDQSKRDKEVIKKPIETPASVTGEKYRGSGTVVDFTTTGSKAFYTVKAPDHSIFYIVIDLDKTEDNVYFLTEINGEELNLSDVVSKPNSATENEVPTQPKPEKEETKSGNSLTFWLIIIVGGIGFIGYHFFFGKLKNLNPILNKDKTDNEAELDDEHDIYNEENLPEETEEFTVSDYDDEEDDK